MSWCAALLNLVNTLCYVRYSPLSNKPVPLNHTQRQQMSCTQGKQKDVSVSVMNEG